ncbi:MAG: DUF3465 domain-containing protein [Candidatus Velthaea sp.]
MTARGAAIVLTALALLAGCGGAGDPAACNMAGFLAVQHAHANKAEVTLCGTVAGVRPVRVTRAGAHRVFTIDVGDDDRIEIDANVDVMGNFPVHRGDPATVRGEYYYDGAGREGVHWTHRSTGRHAAGFVTINGRTYS